MAASTMSSGVAMILAEIAFVYDAPAWIVGTGVVASIILAGMSNAYSDELDSGITSLRDFNCLQNGWSVKTKDGTIINTTEDKSGSVHVETIKKYGEKSIKPATDDQKSLFVVNKKTCEASNSKVANEIKEKFRAMPAIAASTIKSGGLPESSPKGVR